MSELVYPGAKKKKKKTSNKKTALILRVWLEHISQASRLFTAWNGTFSYLRRRLLLRRGDATEADTGRLPANAQRWMLRHITAGTLTQHRSPWFLRLSSVHNIQFQREHMKQLLARLWHVAANLSQSYFLGQIKKLTGVRSVLFSHAPPEQLHSNVWCCERASVIELWTVNVTVWKQAARLLLTFWRAQSARFWSEWKKVLLLTRPQKTEPSDVPKIIYMLHFPSSSFIH